MLRGFLLLHVDWLDVLTSSIWINNNNSNKNTLYRVKQKYSIARRVCGGICFVSYSLIMMLIALGQLCWCSLSFGGPALDLDSSAYFVDWNFFVATLEHTNTKSIIFKKVICSINRAVTPGAACGDDDTVVTEHIFCRSSKKSKAYNSYLNMLKFLSNCMLTEWVL